MSVPFEEIGGPLIDLTTGSFSGLRRFKVAWSDTIAFAVELLGGYTFSGASFSYTPPAVFPGVTQAVCRSLNIVEFPSEVIHSPASTDINGSTNQPLDALVTANYSIENNTSGSGRQAPGMPNVPEGTKLTYNASLGADYLTIPGQVLVWHFSAYAEFDFGGQHAEEAVGEDATAGVIIPTEEFTLDWERVPFALVPWKRLREARGRINFDRFMGYKRGNVLFMGYELNYEHQLIGVTLVKLTLHFKVREVKSTVTGETLENCWNRYYRKEPVPAGVAPDGQEAEGEHWCQVRGVRDPKPWPLTFGSTPYVGSKFKDVFAFATAQELADQAEEEAELAEEEED